MNSIVCKHNPLITPHRHVKLEVEIEFALTSTSSLLRTAPKLPGNSLNPPDICSITCYNKTVPCDTYVFEIRRAFINIMTL